MITRVGQIQGKKCTNRRCIKKSLWIEHRDRCVNEDMVLIRSERATGNKFCSAVTKPAEWVLHMSFDADSRVSNCCFDVNVLSSFNSDKMNHII